MTIRHTPKANANLTTAPTSKLSLLLSMLGFAMLALTACGQAAAETCPAPGGEQGSTVASNQAPFATAQAVVPAGLEEADAKVYVLRPSGAKGTPGPAEAAPKARDKLAVKRVSRRAGPQHAVTPKAVAAEAKAVPTPQPVAPTSNAAGVMQTFKVTGSFGIVASALATGMDKRTPVGVSDRFTTDTDKIWAFIKVKNRDEPTTVTMVWKKAGTKVWSYDLRVGKSHGWRTWSRKSVRKSDVGDWTVEVVDAEGQLLHSMKFSIVPADAAVQG